MEEWTFKTYRQGARNAIEDWLEGLSPTARAAIRTRISYLEARPPTEWRRPQFDKLTGHIHEIRVKDTVEKISYRLLGCFGPGAMVFTLLIGAKEKDKKLEPGTLETANERYQAVSKYGQECLDDYCKPNE
jgi:hypothetical protein